MNEIVNLLEESKGTCSDHSSTIRIFGANIRVGDKTSQFGGIFVVLTAAP